MALDIVFLGQGRDFGCVSAELAEMGQNDLGAAIVFLDLTLDFDLPALELAEVADLFHVAGEDDDRERSNPVVLAEIEEMDASVALLDAENFARDAAGRAYVVPGVRERDAGGGGFCRVIGGESEQTKDEETN